MYKTNNRFYEVALRTITGFHNYFCRDANTGGKSFLKGKVYMVFKTKFKREF